jgi:Arc/MetJ-type ribon-helix-helix transcriptional regulator
MKYRKVTVSIPEEDYNEWQTYVKLYGSFSHFIREGISEYIKLQNPNKRESLLDILLEQRGNYVEIRKLLQGLSESVKQKQKVEDIVMQKNRLLKYLRKFDRATDEELLEWLEIAEDEFLELSSILMKQNIIDLIEDRGNYYWILKKEKKSER